MKMVLGIVLAVILGGVAHASTAESASVLYNKALPVRIVNSGGTSGTVAIVSEVYASAIYNQIVIDGRVSATGMIAATTLLTGVRTDLASLSLVSSTGFIAVKDAIQTADNHWSRSLTASGNNANFVGAFGQTSAGVFTPIMSVATGTSLPGYSLVAANFLQDVGNSYYPAGAIRTGSFNTAGGWKTSNSTAQNIAITASVSSPLINGAAGTAALHDKQSGTPFTAGPSGESGVAAHVSVASSVPLTVTTNGASLPVNNLSNVKADVNGLGLAVNLSATPIALAGYPNAIFAIGAGVDPGLTSPNAIPVSVYRQNTIGLNTMTTGGAGYGFFEVASMNQIMINGVAKVGWQTGTPFIAGTNGESYSGVASDVMVHYPPPASTCDFIVSVGVTPTNLSPFVVNGARRFELYNAGTETLYIGGSNTRTWTGMPLTSGSYKAYDNFGGEANRLYGVYPSTTSWVPIGRN